EELAGLSVDYSLCRPAARSLGLRMRSIRAIAREAAVKLGGGCPEDADSRRRFVKSEVGRKNCAPARVSRDDRVPFPDQDVPRLKRVRQSWKTPLKLGSTVRIPAHIIAGQASRGSKKADPVIVRTLYNEVLAAQAPATDKIHRLLVLG